MKVEIVNKGKVLTANEGDDLLDVLRDNNIFIESPCSGNGTCGKCKVREVTIDGNKDFLACNMVLKDDMKIEVDIEEDNTGILTYGYIPNIDFDNYREGYGIALDIGTTTIAMEIVDLSTGEIVAEETSLNPQKSYGLDVLSRISYEMEKGDNAKEQLHNSLVSRLNEMIESVIERKNINSDEIIEFVASSNSTMAHTLVGESIKSMGHFPFTPIFTSSRTFFAKDIGIKLENAKVITLPHVSAFIGSDIVSGVYSVINQSKKSFLFIDIGTNGELVLYNNGRFVCCSCAAGPAFEGMNISCGVRAKNGAIDDIRIVDDLKITYTTINADSPVGICGSGVLAVVRELLKNNIINKRGSMKNLSDTDEKRIDISKDFDIYFTQGDVRQVQLAKAAILSGIKAMCDICEINYGDIDEVIIAGQFGRHLSIESLLGVGILPSEFEEKISYVGNTSKTGAYIGLMKKNSIDMMEKLSLDMEYFELGTIDNYHRLFAKCSMF